MILGKRTYLHYLIILPVAITVAGRNNSGSKVYTVNIDMIHGYTNSSNPMNEIPMFWHKSESTYQQKQFHNWTNLFNYFS